jgi:hypothetical protein
MSLMLAAVPVLELRGWVVAGGREVAVEVLKVSMMGLRLVEIHTAGQNTKLAWGSRRLLVVEEWKDGV